MIDKLTHKLAEQKCCSLWTWNKCNACVKCIIMFIIVVILLMFLAN